MLSYESIKDKPKLLTVMTSLNKEEFEDLCDLFEEAWGEYKENGELKLDLGAILAKQSTFLP